MARLKAQNDPWTPLPEETNGISQPPCDPRYQLIDSDRYIETLERKLKGIKGRNRPEPSSRDIIDSLAGFKDDQMRRFLQNGHTITAAPSSSSVTASDATTASSGTVNYLQRRLHPERQALNMEELFELLKDDELARNRPEEEEEEGKTKAAASHQTELARQSEACEKDCGENFDVDCSKQTDDSKEEEKEVPVLLENGPVEGEEKDTVCSQNENDTCSKEDDDIASKQDEKDISNKSEEDSSCRQGGSDMSGKGEGDNQGKVGNNS